MENLFRLYLLYADLLDYPAPALPQKANHCTQLLSGVLPEAAEMLRSFEDWVSETPPGVVEETFTNTFDLQGNCCPYVGHYLFGDNYQRSWFMAQLNAAYHEKGFAPGRELPDHIAVILGFLSLDLDDEFSQVLVDEGLIPSVRKMVERFAEDAAHPYGRVLKSLDLLLQYEAIARESNMASAAIGGSAND